MDKKIYEAGTRSCYYHWQAYNHTNLLYFFTIQRHLDLLGIYMEKN